MNIIESGYNPWTGGYYAFFEHEGRQYYADLCFLQYNIDSDSECMIFHSAEKLVIDWSELYCKRGISVSPEMLRKCIDEFINNLGEE